MLSTVTPLVVVELPVDAARGLALAAAVIAPEDVPPFVNSAVDGYAVRSADVTAVPVELRVVDEVAAGAASDHVLVEGEAIRIMTGAPVPAGADAIVMVEDTERLDGGHRVRIGATVPVGASVRGAGDDIAAGTALFGPGTVVTAAVAGVLASVNARTVPVTRRARVAVLSTGDELVTDGSDLRPGQIRESNLTMLLGLVADAGAEPVDLGVVRDDEAALEAVLHDAAASCDAIVTSGGVSMGDYDVVKAVLSRIADMRWMQIAIKPAKPFAFGLLDGGVPVFGLPGNPVSSMVSFELFARPGAAHDDGPPGHRPASRRRCCRCAVPSPARRQDPLPAGHGLVRRRRSGARHPGGRAGQSPAGGDGDGRRDGRPPRWRRGRAGRRRRRHPPVVTHRSAGHRSGSVTAPLT